MQKADKSKKKKQQPKVVAAEVKQHPRPLPKESVVERVYTRKISEDEGVALHPDALYPDGSNISEPGEGYSLKPKKPYHADFPILHKADGSFISFEEFPPFPTEHSHEEIQGEAIISEEEEDEDEEEEEYFPKTPPITPVKVETWEEKLERFNKMVLVSRNAESTNEVSYVYDLRGLHSEPAFERSIHERLHLKSLKKKALHLRRKYASMDNLLLTTAPYPQLMVKPLESNEDFCHYLITKKMKDEWKHVFMKEKKRFSFFDQLFARGHIVDSMELPGNRNDLSYFVEADKLSLRKQVKYARLCFKTKNMYTGNLKNWYFQGHGTYKWVDGAVYEGDFLKGVMHGEGKIVWPDGSVYEGQFLKGIRSGWGVFSTADGYTYAGDWKKGSPEGRGKMWYDPLKNDYDFFDGTWRSGVPEGNGTRVYSNGDRYVGHWSNGVRDGKGSMVWLEDRQIYKGEWLQGIPNGRGQHSWFLGRSSTSHFATRHVYQGEWVNGVREGIGRMLYPTGSWVEGRWRDGQRQGKGILVNPAGDMLVGLFRGGSIVGGTDVPLHTPSYDCDFVTLINSIVHKFNLQNIDQAADAAILTRTTLRCLPQIRQLYERAGRLGQWWGIPGNHPDWLHNAATESYSTVRGGTANSRIGLERERSNNYNKFLSPDNVYPVTRFGLWLLMKDCPGILSAVTTAEYDKLWSSIDSISFQTRHNPFEPVYLWQFLQCLVVVSTTVYVEIPKRRKKWRFGIEPLPTESSTDITNPDDQTNMINKDKSIDSVHVPKSVSATSKSSEVDSILKHKLWHDEGEETEGENDMYNYNNFGEDRGEGSGSEEYASEDEWNTSRNQSPKNQSAISGVRISTPPLTSAQTQLHIPSVKQKLSLLPSSHYHQRRSTVKSHQPERELGIGEAFEKLFADRLIPYLDQEIGFHLPRIPTPLPSLADLYKSFQTTFENEGTDIITAKQFLLSILPHKTQTVNEQPIFWHRSKELLATNADYNFICNLYKEFIAEEVPGVAPENEKVLSEEFLGERIHNTGIFKSEEMKKEFSKSRGQRIGSIEIYGTGNTVFGINKEEEWKQDPPGELDDPVSFIPFAERDLAPKPFLWTPKKNCKHIPRKDSVLKQLTTRDIMKVFRYLYPNVCGRRTNMDFELTFCDWFWCTSLVAKICADREFYSAMRLPGPEGLMVRANGNDGKYSRHYIHTHSAQQPNKERVRASSVISATRSQSLPLVPSESKPVKNPRRSRNLTRTS